MAPVRHNEGSSSNRPENRYHDRSDDTMDDEDVGTVTADEESRRLMMQEVMRNDLSSAVRDRITTSDDLPPRNTLAKSLDQLEAARAVNRKGTREAALYQKNEQKIAGWLNLGSTVDNEGLVEDLDPLLEGQSHRARLSERVQNSGGQNYNFGDDTIRRTTASNDRGGRAGRGGRGGGVIGSRGRGSAAPITPSKQNPMIAVTRPLDPAVDPNRAYGYKESKRSPTRRGLRLPPVGSNSRARGRDGVSQDARGLVAGDEAKMTSKDKENVESPTRRNIVSPPKAVGQATRNPLPAEWTTFGSKKSPDYDSMLNPVAFLKAVEKTVGRKEFNALAPPTPKPAPASKAASIANKATKPTSKSGSDIAKQPPSKLEVAPAAIRKVPTHEFSFPPPNTTSAKPVAGHPSSWTDGIPSPGSFNSDHMSPQSFVRSSATPDNQEAGSTVSDSGVAQTVAAPVRSVGLGITVVGDVSPQFHVASEDLLMLDAGDDDQSQALPLVPSSIMTQNTSSRSDLMDESIGQISQAPLNPDQDFVLVNGVRYYREARSPSEIVRVEDVTIRQAITNPPQASARLSESDEQHSFKRTSKAAETLLGEHNLPGRSREDKANVQSHDSVSKWSDPAKRRPQSTKPEMGYTVAKNQNPFASRSHAPSTSDFAASREQSPALSTREFNELASGLRREIGGSNTSTIQARISGDRYDQNEVSNAGNAVHDVNGNLTTSRWSDASTKVLTNSSKDHSLPNSIGNIDSTVTIGKIQAQPQGRASLMPSTRLANPPVVKDANVTAPSLTGSRWESSATPVFNSSSRTVKPGTENIEYTYSRMANMGFSPMTTSDGLSTPNLSDSIWGIAGSKVTTSKSKEKESPSQVTLGGRVASSARANQPRSSSNETLAGDRASSSYVFQQNPSGHGSQTSHGWSAQVVDTASLVSSQTKAQTSRSIMESAEQKEGHTRSQNSASAGARKVETMDEKITRLSAVGSSARGIRSSSSATGSETSNQLKTAHQSKWAAARAPQGNSTARSGPRRTNRILRTNAGPGYDRLLAELKAAETTSEVAQRAPAIAETEAQADPGISPGSSALLSRARPIAERQTCNVITTYDSSAGSRENVQGVKKRSGESKESSKLCLDQYGSDSDEEEQ